MKKIETYVELVDEGMFRPTEAIDLGNGFYELLPTATYDKDDEEWEFLPGARVKAEQREYNGKSYLLAIKAEQK